MVFLSVFKKSEPLLDLFNDSIEKGVFLDYLKLAKIKLLYKGKNSKTDMNNYRPISLLCCMSEVFEKLFLDHVESFFNKHKLIKNNQHDFRWARRCTTTLFDLVNIISSLMDKKKIVGLLETDLTENFNFFFLTSYIPLVFEATFWIGVCLS